MVTKIYSGLAAIASVLLVSQGAYAQTVPSTVDPGSLQRGIQSSSGKQQIVPGPTAVPNAAPTVVAPEGAENLSFVLRSVSLDGGSVYDDAELQKLVSSSLGGSVSVAEVFKFAAAMTARYRNDGYILSRVIVPPQKIDDGMVVLKAVEGYVDSVKVEGLSVSKENAVLGYLGKLVGQRPLSKGLLERYLLLVDDLPGVSLQSFFEPSPDNSGAATITVKVAQKKSDVWSRADNRGSDLVGPYRVEVGGVYNSLAPIGMAVTGKMLTTPVQNEELRYVGFSVSREVDKEGSAVIIGVNGMTSEPGGSLKTLNVKSNSFGSNVGFRIKPLRSRVRNLTLDLSASATRSTTKALGFDLSKDDSRQVRAAGEFQFNDRFAGATSFSVGLNQGLPIFGATKKGDVLQSRANADPGAVWVDAGVSRVQMIGRGFLVSASVRGQYAVDPLSAAREFGVGGEGSGSAFDSSEYTGDHGVSGRMELRYSGSVPNRGIEAGYQGYIFGDGGAVWQEGSQIGQTNDKIASAGVGLRFNVGEHFSGNVEVAQPFVREVSSRSDKMPRVFFGLVGRF
jgi:hemolysin activation/secretion protein